ncbi:unnamed protein product [Ectocarpus fasciculatus]
MLRRLVAGVPHDNNVRMRTSFLLSLVPLRRSNALSTSTRSLRLVAFRGRSWHTSGFEPYEKFELAP